MAILSRNEFSFGFISTQSIFTKFNGKENRASIITLNTYIIMSIACPVEHIGTVGICLQLLFVDKLTLFQSREQN